MIEITVTAEGQPLDLILWRRFGRPGLALVEAVFDANPGLAGFGLAVPLGRVIRVPDVPAPTRTPATAVSLFD